jgi:hypothetical protein
MPDTDFSKGTLRDGKLGLEFGLSLVLTSLVLKTEWIDFELGVSEGLRVRIVIRLIQERVNTYPIS